MSRTRTTHRFAPLRLAAAAAVAAIGIACNGDSVTGPGTTGKGDILLVTTLTGGTSSFLSAINGLSSTSVTNASAFETTLLPRIFTRGDMVLLVEGARGDMIRRFDRAADGTLTRGATLAAPAASSPMAVAFASDTKAFVSLTAAGKLLVINPATMTKTGEIDLSSSAIGDNNPDPGAMVIRDGKLFVALMQKQNYVINNPGAHVAVIDVATNAVESVTHDLRLTGAGLEQTPGSLFVDDAGDVYVYCVASYGYAPGQKGGFLRIKKGSTTFDASYVLNLTDASVSGVPGGKSDYLNAMAYGGGKIYAVANVPALASNPPDYLHDHTYQPISIDVATGAITALTIPPSNGYAGGIAMYGGKVLFGLSTSVGTGLFVFDPVTRAAVATPTVTTQGDPAIVLTF